MAKQTFTTGQVLTAAQMTSLQQTAMGGGSPSAKTASYVLVAADAGTTIQMNSSSATTITVNTSLFSAGDSLQIQNIGTGSTTITAGTATVNTAGGLAITQWDGGFLYFTSTSSAIWFDYTQSGFTNPMTTTGDMIYASSGSTPARLGIGTFGQVLTVNSGATAPEWTTAAGGTANWTLLNSGGTALTGAQTVTVSGISGKDKIMVLVDGASSASAGSLIYVRLNADTGSNYYIYGSDSYITATYAASNYNAINGAGAGFRLAFMSASATSTVSGYVLLSGCNASGVKVMNAAGAANAATSNNQQNYVTGGYYNSSSTISSVSVFSSSGNLDAGTVYVYASA